MIRRAVAAVLFSVLLLCGFASRADASASRTCIYISYVISSNPMRICMPFFAE
jgi:hypothetical protein